MSQEMHNIVISKARHAHKKWRATGKASAGTKLAADITKIWQESLKAYKPRIETEYKISEKLDEKIDVVDKVSGIAYEMKVSPNNPNHEFYRDIFKAILARENFPNLKKLFFLTPTEGADKLKRGMGEVVEGRSICGIKIEIEPL